MNDDDFHYLSERIDRLEVRVDVLLEALAAALASASADREAP